MLRCGRRLRGAFIPESVLRSHASRSTPSVATSTATSTESSTESTTESATGTTITASRDMFRVLRERHDKRHVDGAERDGRNLLRGSRVRGKSYV